jgi:FkbM family methyltransferase
MNLKSGLRRRAGEFRKERTLALERGHASLRGTGLALPGAAGAVNVRVLPSAAQRAPLALDLDVIAAGLSAGRERVGFVQIGAFDGDANDPLHDPIVRLGWRGVLVEPQPEAFARLQRTYAGIDGLVFLNAAIAAERGIRPFYFIAGSEPGDPWWRGQIASFDREHLMKHIRDDRRLADQVTSRDVETLTLSDVFARAPEPVDVLQIDAEGHDAQIVSSLDLTTHQPEVIRFEHKHLSCASTRRPLITWLPAATGLPSTTTTRSRCARGRAAAKSCRMSCSVNRASLLTLWTML